MNKSHTITCIIPARGGSKRLPRKNIKKVLGKPMIQWGIEACLKSKFLDSEKVFVSSEDEEILNLSKVLGVQTIKRPQELSEDNVWTQDDLKHAVEVIAPVYQSKGITSLDIVIRVQANTPQVTSEKIDECIEKLINNNLWEVFTVNEEGIEDAAIHVMKSQCVFQSALSVYKGVVRTNFIDIHSEADRLSVEEKMKNG